MKASTFRSLGFALPIVLLATALHVEKDPAWGSWLDGLLSGAWFAGLFALGAWIVSRSGAFDRRVEGRAAALELAAGAGLGLLAWFLLWAAWQIPAARQLESAAFVLNSLVFLAARLASRPTLPGRRRVPA